ncbi:unnamed protein product [Ectocarpus sp. CCAP 1310/34]|nr:unnamed protein product [Ectocarpus sp. CCAP 1310/34]
MFCCHHGGATPNGSFHIPSQHLPQVDTFQVPNNLQVRNASVASPSSPDDARGGDGSTATTDRQAHVLRVSWGDIPAGPQDTRDGKEGPNTNTSTIPIDWLRRHCTSATARDLRRRHGGPADGPGLHPRPVLWGADVFSAGTPQQQQPPACMSYEDVMADGALDEPEEEAAAAAAAAGSSPPPAPGASPRLVDLIRSHGVALVRGVPTDEKGTEALALRVGGHLRSTLYGPGMWATSAEASAGEEGFRDSAYSNDGLALHTDCGYLADPPGIQVFNCVVRAREGGASIYVDGFAVAERLRATSPEAFEFFSRTSISYQCFDEGCHYMAEGPVFRLGALGEVVQVRYNDYDRAPLDYLSNEDIDRFYEYHASLSKIIRDPSLVARIVLEPGECVILNNHRALHGRESFKGRRRMVGCYLGMDELESSARVQRM